MVLRLSGPPAHEIDALREPAGPTGVVVAEESSKKGRAIGHLAPLWAGRRPVCVYGIRARRADPAHRPAQPVAGIRPARPGGQLSERPRPRLADHRGEPGALYLAV